MRGLQGLGLDAEYVSELRKLSLMISCALNNVGVGEGEGGVIQTCGPCWYPWPYISFIEYMIEANQTPLSCVSMIAYADSLGYLQGHIPWAKPHLGSRVQASGLGCRE